jgi:menaquinone-specific isochorismate synthase
VEKAVVRTVEVEDDIDAVHVMGEDGLLFESTDESLAGTGQAIRLDIPIVEGLETALEQVAATLRQLRAPQTSSEPVAFVSVPFSERNNVIAIVPEITVRQHNTGVATITAIGKDVSIPARFEKPSNVQLPHEFSIRPSRSPKEWCDSVDEAIGRLRKNELQKVVLAREVVIEADAPFSQVATIRQLRRLYPSTFRFAFEGFIGATPELLIERTDRDIRSVMLAGTSPRSNDTFADEALANALMRSSKDRTEHRYLAEMVRESLLPFTSHLDVPATPGIMSLANVHHLATTATGVLSSPETSVLELVARLHPTPAVGGRPTAEAIAMIDELEELDRGRYAGAIGWVDASGNGRFTIALRCAQLQGSHARLYAGMGIVAASHTQREFEETQWKFQAMLSALVRP